MFNPIYQNQGNVNNYISKIGLIRLYKKLLADNKININGPAHKRLKKLINEEDWNYKI